MVESVGHREGRSDVLISPDQAKLDEFLDLERPKSKKDVQQLCGLAAQMKKFAPGMQVTYPGMQKLCAANVCFSWTADLDKELTDLKTCLKRHVKLSPVDTTKGLILVIDSAATVGTSYLLLQEKEVGNPAMGMNFISMDSSNFKRGQINMCPFEAEVAGLRYAVKKEGHYLVACPQITVVTDCKSLGSAYQKPLEEIKNRRVMKMFMDVSHVNLVFKHIPGVLNSTTDYRSRHPRDSWEATGEDDSQIRMRLGVRSVRAEAADLHPVDIRLEKMAERAGGDQEYQQMIKYLEQGTPVEEMDQTSELYAMNGERQFLGTVKMENGFSLIVKDEEVMIPKGDRQAILEELHSTHLSSQGMKKLARGKMTWRGMNKDIERLYEGCESCLTHARSKPHKNNARCEVLPASLELSVAGEKIVADFAQYGPNNLLVIKDRYSGLVRVYAMKDLTMKSAIKGYFQWAHSYGLASEVRTDDGPGFRSEFTAALNHVGTRHINSSAYSPTSNGCAERGVGQVKSVLEKLGKKSVLSQEFLNLVVYKINSHVAKETGSALQRFFGRSVQTYLPELVKKTFNQAVAIKKRSEEQLAIANKLGRRSADMFKTGDLVVCQNTTTGKWTVRGRIIKARTAEDGSVRTFEVKTESGNVTLRNARFIVCYPQRRHLFPIM